jgi:tetratricopeptide (TPR) repeat protein
MTRDEAVQLLGLSESQDPNAVRESFNSRNADLTQRVTSAPTTALRAVYEQRADRLRQARDLLLGEVLPRPASSPLTDTQIGDLPQPFPIATGWAGPVEREDGAALGITPEQLLAERFEVREALGSGGMGRVFVAFDRVRKEEVAVKVLLPHLLADPKARERFLNEAKVANSLSHPNIVRVFDIHQTQRFTFLTMERLQGHGLREEISRRSEKAERFSVSEVRSIAEPLCEALQYSHKVTVHRDIKPENIWLGEDGSVKLMDFGIARLLRHSQFTSTGLALGTAYYMAPEQLRGQEVDHRADQFSLGVVLYELLTGEIPQGVIRPPHQLRRSVPAGMSQAVMRSLELRPQARHADMAALGRALASRSRNGLGTRAVVLMVVALILCAAVTFPIWRTWTDGLKGDPTDANGTTKATAETKAAEAAYGKQWSQVEELKSQAEAIGAELETEAKASPDVVAKQVADLWRRHPQRREWPKRAMDLQASAQALAKKRDFEPALADLKAAVAEYRKPQQWWDNARRAMESIGKTRSLLEERLKSFSDTPRVLSSWPKTVQAEVEAKLLQGDGAEGLSEARQTAEAMTEVDGLIPLRLEVTKTITEGREFPRIAGLQRALTAMQVLVAEADEALLLGRFGNARRLYTKATREGSKAWEEVDAELRKILAAGKASIETGEYDDAISQFGQIIALRPQRPDSVSLRSDGIRLVGGILISAYEHRARAYRHQGDIDRAIADFNETIRIAPNLAEAYYNRGLFYSEYFQWVLPLYIRGGFFERRKGYRDRAIADFSEAIRVDRNHANAYWARGNIYWEDKQYDDAITDYSEVIRLSPKYFHAYYQRGLAYSEKGDYDRAIAGFSEAIRIDPEHAGVYYDRGFAHSKTSDYDRAIADYSEAIRIYTKGPPPSTFWSKYEESYTERGLAHSNKGEYDRAIADYSEAIRIDPKGSFAYCGRGDVNLRKGDYDRAIADYNEAIRNYPSYRNAHYGRGLAYSKKRDYDRAIADYNGLLIGEPNSAEAHYGRGLAYSKKGDYDRAIADFNEAKRIDFFSFGLSVTLGKSGDDIVAEAYFKRAKKLDNQP